MNGTDARGGNRTLNDLEAPEAARGIGAGTLTAIDPYAASTRWQRGPSGEVYGSGLTALFEMQRAYILQHGDHFHHAEQARSGTAYRRHPTQHNVWVPTDEHPDVNLTPKQIFEKYVGRRPSLPIYQSFEPVEAPAKPLPAMVRVVADKDGKNTRTEAGPAPIDIERVRRETRDHITGNGKPWFTDPNAAPPEAKPIGTTTWCGVCNRNVTGEPCVTVYAGAVKGCSPSGVA